MRTNLLIAVTAAAVVAAPATAVATSYTSRTAFNAAAGATVTETFQSCSGSLNAGQALSAAAPGPCGSIVTGVTFNPPPGASSSFYIAGPGQSTNPTIALGIDQPSGGAEQIVFSSGATAFGTDLFQNFSGGSQGDTVTVIFKVATYTLDGTLLDSFDVSVAPNGGSFFGLTTGTAFSYVTVAQPGGYAVIDNVSFGNGAVPEPASWALMITGFAAVGIAARRRRLLAA